jgi:hypothetical protein
VRVAHRTSFNQTEMQTTTLVGWRVVGATKRLQQTLRARQSCRYWLPWSRATESLRQIC